MMTYEEAALQDQLAVKIVDLQEKLRRQAVEANTLRAELDATKALLVIRQQDIAKLNKWGESMTETILKRDKQIAELSDTNKKLVVALDEARLVVALDEARRYVPPAAERPIIVYDQRTIIIDPVYNL